jgi:hypothetical protein
MFHRHPDDAGCGGGGISVQDMEGHRKLWSHNNSKTALHSPSSTSPKNFDLQMANWRMESIVRDSDSGSDDEFFDCQGMQTHKIVTSLVAFVVYIL